MKSPSRPPDFLESFKESLLLVSRDDSRNLVDLSTDDSCLKGSVTFGESQLPAINRSCYEDEGSQLSCVLTDGRLLVDLKLSILDPSKGECQPVNFRVSQGPRLYLEIWVPVVGSVLLCLIVALLIFALVRRRKNKRRSDAKQLEEENQTKHRTDSSSSTRTEISFVSVKLSPSPSRTVDCHSPIPSRGDSAFSSLGTIPEEDSTADETKESHQDACRPIEIIQSPSTADLPSFLRLSGFDETNAESSTDATLGKKSVVLSDVSVESEYKVVGDYPEVVECDIYAME